MRQAAASFGRDVITMLPLISALALICLMSTLPICFAALPPSSPPSASPIAPVTFADSEPVTFSVPVSGVDSDKASCAPVAAIGPREAVQPISAFCRICGTGFSALPLKFRGAPRSAASRMADSAMATEAITVELREAGGSGGNSTSSGGWTVSRGDTQSMTFRLIRNDAATTAMAIRIVFETHRQTHRPPGPIELQHDPEKRVPVFPRDKRYAFARRSCSNKTTERDDDSRKVITPGRFYRVGERCASPGKLVSRVWLNLVCASRARADDAIRNGPGECRSRSQSELPLD